MPLHMRRALPMYLSNFHKPGHRRRSARIHTRFTKSLFSCWKNRPCNTLPFFFHPHSEHRWTLKQHQICLERLRSRALYSCNFFITAILYISSDRPGTSSNLIFSSYFVSCTYHYVMLLTIVFLCKKGWDNDQITPSITCLSPPYRKFDLRLHTFQLYLGTQHHYHVTLEYYRSLPFLSLSFS